MSKQKSRFQIQQELAKSRYEAAYLQIALVAVMDEYKLTEQQVLDCIKKVQDNAKSQEEAATAVQE